MLFPWLARKGRLGAPGSIRQDGGDREAEGDGEVGADEGGDDHDAIPGEVPGPIARPGFDRVSPSASIDRFA
jgi:hypothetical protein